ncbi:hypothetical protein [Phenylobacterium sp.]|uniref:hypothetical protein n=1 Tax=Phenylobacterium sp. TaxID=1871053 RepID=UPI0011FB23E7|nr:hypothetical protein [Phenylobacterium sp.]THD62078.1 MAG: hypothetical protein E8A12_09655 [Phenylobacterium sp.]
MMTSNPDPQIQAIRRAARRFTDALAAERMLHATARVEVWFSADAPASLFALDEALTSAWPQAEGARPRHEMVWASGRGDGLRLSAFDAAGRVLLRRSYQAAGERKGAGHV